jgi:hypothetical protein
VLQVYNKFFIYHKIGKQSRVECLFLCPVYDPLFGPGVAPGQMTKEEIISKKIMS